MQSRLRTHDIAIPLPRTNIELREIITDLAQRLGKPIVFLLDEVDNLLKADQRDYEEGLFKTFHTLSSQHVCQWIFTGERHLRMSMQNADSRLFNFTHSHRIKLLNREDVNKLIQEPLNDLDLRVGPEVLNLIHDFSVGHPWIVQRICTAVIDVLNNAVDDQQRPRFRGSKIVEYEMAVLALKDVEVRKEIVKTFQGQASHLAYILTYLWPEDVASMTIHDMTTELTRRNVLGTIADMGTLEAAIEDLKVYHFLREIDDMQYAIIPTTVPKLMGSAANRELRIRYHIEQMSQMSRSLNGNGK
jgi:hypothetical protein